MAMAMYIGETGPRDNRSKVNCYLIELGEGEDGKAREEGFGIYWIGDGISRLYLPVDQFTKTEAKNIAARLTNK